jgi:hypothetical protein
MTRAGADKALGAKPVWMIAVILPAAGSARTSPDGVSTRRIFRPATICGVKPPPSTCRLAAGWSERWLIRVMWSTPAQPIQMPRGPRLHQRHRIQPDRCDAARPLGQGSHDPAGGGLSGHPGTGDRPVFALVKAAIDRGAAEGTRKLTGIWPGDTGQPPGKSV